MDGILHIKLTKIQLFNKNKKSIEQQIWVKDERKTYARKESTIVERNI